MSVEFGEWSVKIRKLHTPLSTLHTNNTPQFEEELQ